MQYKEYMSISKKTQRLLIQEEGYDVEFKQSISGLDASDIVAFANSKDGGTILIGIQEQKTISGRQKGKIVGCEIGDKTRLTVLNKAQSCSPAISVEIIIENARTLPFYRIEIPSGRCKPYSTSGGTYKIRGDGRTNALLPNELLSIFEENEGQRFLEKFRTATQELQTDLLQTKSKILEEMENLLYSVSSMENGIENSLEQVFNSAQSAESLADDAMCFSDETLGEVRQIQEDVGSISEVVYLLNDKLTALLNKHGIEDPRITRDRQTVERLIEGLYKPDAIADETEILNILLSSINGIPEEKIREWCANKLVELKTKSL